MNMIEQIKADREAGTPGPWSAFTDDTAPHTNIVSPVPHTSCVFSLPGRHKRHPDIKRVCRVPDMEAALIAAEELANAVDFMNESGCQTAVSQLMMCMAAYRAATGAK